MKKLLIVIVIGGIICGMLMSCTSMRGANKSEEMSVYTEEQLKALGKVMVGGDLVIFEYTDEANVMMPVATGTMTFVDSNMSFAAYGHEEQKVKTINKSLYASHLASVDKSGIKFDFNSFPKTIGVLESFFSTEDGLFGQMNGFVYETSKEMEFGIPKAGAAQIYLIMPDNKSGWYEIFIHEKIIFKNPNSEVIEEAESDIEIQPFTLGTSKMDFQIEFTDAGLPDDFTEYNHSGRSGSPIIQSGKLVGAFSCFDANNVGTLSGANLAADMRFVQLKKYDKSFNAEFFRDVPTLKNYFD